MGYSVEVERGIKLYVEDTGEGIPVLMVHGWPLDHRMYEYQVALLPSYGYRCIQVDLRGFGVTQLILLGAATPRFTPSSDFPQGTPVTEVDKLIKQAYTDRPQLVTSFGELLFANPVSQSFGDWIRDQGFASSVHSMAFTLYSLRDSDLRKELTHIRVPTWILHGKLDQVCPFPLAVETQKGIAGSRLIPFERSGHAVFYDALPEFNSTLLSILSQPSPMP
ncbi:alpha/beta hydrolase [Paenibacillus terrae]|uniref:Alpha/beta hydrolase n=1 Tax=Paenibacillus terrae TaxID=159743 RepID=A0A4U2Q1U3_9BACL|nr:alpha/beta hydrolase [Paenibacillus terrae]TKH45149.1 alpha/beta hydrolase [Paenibacillus terrae]